MTRDTFRIEIVSTFALLVLLALLLVAGVTAQSPGEEGTPTPSAKATGKLKASRTILGLGDTTEVAAYDVSPANTGIKLVVSNPLRYGSCESAEDSGPQSLPLLFEPPVTVTLTARGAAGTSTVRLETLSGLELASL